MNKITRDKKEDLNMDHLNLQTTIFNMNHKKTLAIVLILLYTKNQNISRVFLKFNKKGKRKYE